MRSHRYVVLFLLVCGFARAEEAKCPPAVPEVDPVAQLEKRQDSALAAWDRQLPVVASKPSLLGVNDLRTALGTLEHLENDAMSDAFRLTGGHSVRSIPSAEMEAHLDIVKAAKKAATLLDEAKEATEAHQPHVAQLHIAAAAKEVANLRKQLAAKRKVRAAHSSKATAEPKAKSEPKGKK